MQDPLKPMKKKGKVEEIAKLIYQNDNLQYPRIGLRIYR